jgi:hypothetical protein
MFLHNRQVLVPFAGHFLRWEWLVNDSALDKYNLYKSAFQGYSRKF